MGSLSEITTVILTWALAPRFEKRAFSFGGSENFTSL